MKRSNHLSAGGPVFHLAWVLTLGLGLLACEEDEGTPRGAAAQEAVGGHAGGPSGEPGFSAEWDRREFDHALWDDVLKRQVNARGLVDYVEIGRDREFREYLYRLSKTDDSGLANDRQRLAFWINAYNALTIRAVLDTLPAERSKWADYKISKQKVGGRSIWKGVRFSVGGGTWTLDAIEHEILRKRDGFRDPRVHVALVCAARGCPRLWDRAYDPKQIDEQLTAAMRRFVEDERQCKIEVPSRRIKISKVFDWYASDFTNPRFTPHAKTVPAFLARYVKDAALAKALERGRWKMKYYEYDWRLNLRE